MEATMVFWFGIWMVCGLFALLLADARGLDKAGAFIIGIALGPLGIGIVLLMKPAAASEPQEERGREPAADAAGISTYVKCAACDGFSPVGSRFCNHCGQALTP